MPTHNPGTEDELDALVASSAYHHAQAGVIIGLCLCGIGAWFSTGGFQVLQPWDQMNDIKLPEGAVSFVGATPAFFGLIMAASSLIVLKAGGDIKSDAAVELAAHGSVGVSVLGQYEIHNFQY